MFVLMYCSVMMLCLVKDAYKGYISRSVQVPRYSKNHVSSVCWCITPFDTAEHRLTWYVPKWTLPKSIYKLLQYDHSPGVTASAASLQASILTSIPVALCNLCNVLCLLSGCEHLLVTIGSLNLHFSTCRRNTELFVCTILKNGFHMVCLFQLLVSF